MCLKEDEKAHLGLKIPDFSLDGGPRYIDSKTEYFPLGAT
jgi:hypothetical protein